MGKIADATFEGKFGTYAFEIYTTDTIFNSVGAVYIFSKRDVNLDGSGKHSFLYIGQTHSLKERIPNHEKWHCVRSYGTNCICVHRDNDANSRLRKEIDLRAVNKTPCNAQ
jgi:predicted GIY-YIG superfamily endonuclease